MFQKMLEWLRRQLGQLFGAKADSDILLGAQMENALALWVEMYEHGGPWCGGREGVQSLSLPASVAAELARLVTAELELTVRGSARADYLAGQLQPVLERLPVYTELGCALGGLVFKPYLCDDGLRVDAVQADSFFPISFDDSGRMTGAVFSQQLTRKGMYYTRLEYHDFAGGRQTVRNRAFVSASAQTPGRQIALQEVPEWAGLREETVIEGLKRPLWGFFRTPGANREDRHAPLGASVYAAAVHSIRDADEQYGRLLWEYEGGELAIDVDEIALRRTPDGRLELPKREQRLFRGRVAAPAGGNLFEQFAPALRDESYRRGLDAILKRVEFQCGLAYGTLSDPQSVDKTATEVLASKQRSYSTVKALQRALQTALEDLLEAMDALCTLYDLSPAGPWQAAFDWDDSLVNDPQQRKAMFWQYVQADRFPFARYLQEFEGYSEEEAAAVVAEAAESGARDDLRFDAAGGV